jgi:hypothetical protein
MKSLVCLNLILYLTGNTIYAQDSTDISFIEKQLRIIQPEAILFYSDKPIQDIFLQFKKSIRKRVVNHQNNTITFSNKEIKQISNALKLNMQTTYEDALFNKSKKVPASEIVSVVESQNQNILDSLAHLDRSKMPKKQILHWAFSFSRPIYFHDKKWMLFYLLYYENSSGQHGLYLYKWTNNDWEYWGILQSGAW